MNEKMLCAQIIYYTGFFGFIAYVLISYILKNKMATNIFAQDLKVYRKIVPHYNSWFINILGFVLLGFIPTSFAIDRQEYTPIIFVVIAYIFIGTLMFKDSCKRLDLEDEHIVITAFHKKANYLRSDIRTIEWKECRCITGKQLFIIFNNGAAYSFNMDYFRGVQNTYNDLTK